MTPSARIVTQLPLDRLGDESGELDTTRVRWLSKSALREMLRNHPVVLFVADVAKPLKRLGVQECFDFWKSEVLPHLVDDPESGFQLEDYPGDYAYVASEWSGDIQSPIVLLEKHH